MTILSYCALFNMKYVEILKGHGGAVSTLSCQALYTASQCLTTIGYWYYNHIKSWKMKEIIVWKWSNFVFLFQSGDFNI